jgi:anaerobic selenocysteine-containing dehydrogenase
MSSLVQIDPYEQPDGASHTAAKVRSQDGHDDRRRTQTGMVCGFCSTGCSLDVQLEDGRAVGLLPSTDYPVNQGMACPKGWESLNVLSAPDRATTPLLRDRRGRLKPVDWDRAMTEFRDRFQAIQKNHGPESVAFLSSGQIPTEEMAMLGSLAKFGMGMLHGDGNTRQCMASAVVAYKQSFGFDAPPYTYQDFEESDVIVLVGSNLCIAHPIMWQRILRNPHNPQIIVVDPRKTETAMAATQHLPLRPKSDLTLFYGLAFLLIQEGWLDRDFIREHTSSFIPFAEHVERFTPEFVARETGIDETTLRRTAATIAQGERVSFWWTMGVNQSYEGVRTAQSLINLALMTGNIGRPGTGANSITGQCNAMGSRMFSNTTSLLGGRDFTNAEHRREVAQILEIDAEKIPDQNSLPYHQIIERILAGKIKGLWVVATNTSHSWINQNMARDVLDRLDFLVVQDMYHSTETAAQAHLVLPAAGWGEKEGTFINSERRFGLLKKVAAAPGQALTDFSILKLVSHYWGCGQMFAKWHDPEAVFEILRRLSAGQPCDFSGIEDYRMIDERGGIQWPYPAKGADESPERRLFADGQFYHSDGRAKFIFEMPGRMPEPPSERYPCLLLTGRGSAAQWHTQTRTAKSAVLGQLAPKEIYVEINPQDARREGIRPSQQVLVESQRGRLKAKAFITHTVAPGQVFIPMHYATTNRLTHAHFDPYSSQPSYKNCAVRIRRAETWDATE